MRDVTQRGAKASGTAQVVVFDLAGAQYAMDVRAIEEVIELQEVTKLPDAEPWIEGTTLFRDQKVPVLNLRRRFGLNRADPTDDTRIVVVSGRDGLVGLVVDAVSEVMDVPGGHIEPLGGVVRSSVNRYVAGVVKLEGQLVCLVDVDQIVPAAA